MIGVNQLSYKQTGDFKALNILTGIMSCSSLYGCCYCEAARGSEDWMINGGRLRTFENIRENTNRLKASGD